MRQLCHSEGEIQDVTHHFLACLAEVWNWDKRTDSEKPSEWVSSPLLAVCSYATQEWGMKVVAHPSIVSQAEGDRFWWSQWVSVFLRSLLSVCQWGCLDLKGLLAAQLNTTGLLANDSAGQVREMGFLFLRLNILPDLTKHGGNHASWWIRDLWAKGVLLIFAYL